MKNIIIIFSLVNIQFIQVIANIRHVPGAYPTIQSALMSCQSNDTVLVQAGNYPENLSWPAVNGIKLLSVSGPDSTVL